MTTIFDLNNDDDVAEQLDIDELFERKKQHDLNEYNLFKKLLNRIHSKIKIASRQKINDQYIWFLVPEFILGYPKYDQGNCIGFLIDKLKRNNFLVNYYHPNLLFIYWGHIIPKYVRSQVKEKLGVNIDIFGNKIISEKEKLEDTDDYNDVLLQENKVFNTKQSKKKEYNNKFKDINNYKPTGNLTYNKILFDEKQEE